MLAIARLFWWRPFPQAFAAMLFDGTHAFPATYADLSTSELLQAYAEGPARLRHVLAGLDDEHLHARPFPGKWSILEIAVHLADAEVMGAARVRQTIAEPGRTFAVYDQEAWTTRFAYQGFSRARLDAAVDLFTQLRATTLPLFTQAHNGTWSQQGLHPELGPVTLRQLLELYADHSERHLAQILDRRTRLGVPLGLAPLLPVRLY